MSLYKFQQNDIFRNRIKTHPRVYFLVNDTRTYYNNNILPLSDAAQLVSGTETVQHTPQGHTSLYEININREEGVGNAGLVYPYVTKQGSLESFKTVTTESFQNFQYGDEISGSYPLSASISTDYYEADSDRRRVVALKNTFNYYRKMSNHFAYENTEWNKGTQEMKLISIPSIFYGSSIKKGSVDMKFYITGSMVARLQDTGQNGELIQTVGPDSASAEGSIEFTTAQSSFYDNGRIILQNSAGTEKTFIFDDTNTEGSTGDTDGDGFIVVQVDGLATAALIATQFAIAVESVTGFQITTDDDSSGTITLTQDVAGIAGNTVIGNPDVISGLTPSSFSGGTDTATGNVAGVVLYNEGFVALTGSWDLSSTHTEDYLVNGVAIPPKWTYWGQKDYTAPSSPENFAPSSSWDISAQGTNYVPTLTMFAHAKEGDLNHSNNPTFVDYEDRDSGASNLDTFKYVENPEKRLANVVKSPYPNTSGSFEKTTYISKIGIYDEDKNLIAIAKLATPVKKTESRTYTFKMKIDF